jgi:UPF0755 protein
MMWLGILVGCGVGNAPLPGSSEESVFEVPKGATARGLGDELAAAGLVTSESDWTWFLRLGADGSCLKAGKHRVSPSMNAEALLRALCGVPIPDDVPFTVLEGWRARDIDAALAAAGLAEAGSYLEATESAEGYTAAFTLPTRSLEGYLFPETYQVAPKGFTAHAFVQRQLDLFGDRFGNAAAASLGGRTLDEVVIVASMLEREEPALANRPLVAGVIWKRLDAKWNLGIDATSRYLLADWTDERAFLKRLFDPADPYNTRLRGGLPPGAIGNAGVGSLRSALAPESSEFWYYLHDGTGKIHPAKSQAEHEANKRKYL